MSVRSWPAHPPERSRPATYGRTMFAFYSNRLGCAGSLLVTLVATLVLLTLFGAIDL